MDQAFLFLWVDNWFHHWLLERSGLIARGLSIENIKNAAVHINNDFAQIWRKIERDTWTRVDEFVEMVDEALALAATSPAGGKARLARIRQDLARLDSSPMELS